MNRNSYKFYILIIALHSLGLSGCTVSDNFCISIFDSESCNKLDISNNTTSPLPQKE